MTGRMHKVNVIRLGIDKFVAHHRRLCRHSNAPGVSTGLPPSLAHAVGLVCSVFSALPTAAQPIAGGQAAEYARIVLARPLFTKDRRPPSGATGAAAVADETLPRLSGIVIAAAYRRAIFDGNGRPKAYREGDRVGRYTILAIGKQQVTLAGPDGEQAIGLSFGANRPTALTTPPVPPGPSILDRLNSHAPYRPVMPHLPTPEEFQARMDQPPQANDQPPQANDQPPQANDQPPQANGQPVPN